MSLMSVYLNQTAQWQKKTSENVYAEPVYADAVTIRCRNQGHGTLYHTNHGDTQMSHDVYYCEATPKISVGDLLDGSLVLDVQSMVAFEGTVVGLKVLV